MTDDQYVAKAIDILRSKPTAGDIDFLVSAYHVIGNLAAEAEGLAEERENRRKHVEANEYLRAKLDAEKAGKRLTEREAEAVAMSEAFPERTFEVEARTNARKLRNLMLSLQEAINAIKFLGRLT